MSRSGVIMFKNAPVAYDCHDEQNWLAQEIGREELLVITPELRAAIMADRVHQQAKRGAP